jgi:hypothetical protein
MYTEYLFNVLCHFVHCTCRRGGVEAPEMGKSLRGCRKARRASASFSHTAKSCSAFLMHSANTYNAMSMDATVFFDAILRWECGAGSLRCICPEQSAGQKAFDVNKRGSTRHLKSGILLSNALSLLWEYFANKICGLCAVTYSIPLLLECKSCIIMETT